jgi:hypothetical protein
MSEQLADILDLSLAWKRVKDDFRDRVFLRHPYAVEVIESDLRGWLTARLDSVRDGSYAPASMYVCEVPKGRGLVRPGSHLSYVDRVIYAACVGACFQAIHEALKWSQGKVDLSYRLAVQPSSPDWIRDRFTGWQEFRQQSLRRIDAGALYVVMADISAFYENVDISVLLSDLKQSGPPGDAVEQIARCLNKWAQVPGRGIPQGQSPSDILAKLYLNNVDLNLQNMGYDHLRYVDDIRVFCKDVVAAKRVLIDLSRLLRKRGLSLQAAKSEIYRADQARDKIEGIAVVLKGVAERFINQVVRETGIGDPYISIPEADDILGQNPEEAPAEIITEAYQTYFVDSPNQFNPTLFHFLLNRLGNQADSFAEDHTVTLLEPHPAEILEYLSRLQDPPVADLVEFLSSDAAIYDFQNHQILEFFLKRENIPEELISVARQMAFDPTKPRYLRTVGRALLGRFGSVADLERLFNSYDETNDPSEKGEIICSLCRLEKGRRNSFLSRAEQDGEMSARAARWVRSQAVIQVTS